MAPALSGPLFRRSSCICSPCPSGQWWSNHLMRSEKNDEKILTVSDYSYMWRGGWGVFCTTALDYVRYIYIKKKGRIVFSVCCNAWTCVQFYKNSKVAFTSNWSKDEWHLQVFLDWYHLFQQQQELMWLHSLQLLRWNEIIFTDHLKSIYTNCRLRSKIVWDTWKTLLMY